MLSALVAISAAAPSGIHSYGALPLAVDYAPEYHVSNLIQHVPTAVSHQSRIDYHSKPVYTPIIAPVLNTVQAVHHAPIAYSAPLVHSAPILHSEPWLGAHGW